MSDKIIINPEVTELITVTRRDSRVVVSSPGTPGPAGQPGTTDYNALNNKPDLTQYATQTYVNTAITNIVDGAPGVLDTLNELAAAINDDSSFASTITTALGNKQDKVSGVSDTEIGYLDGVTSSIQTQLNDKSTASKTETLTNKTLTTPIINGPMITATGQTPTIHGIYLPSPHTIIFEGTSADDFETTLAAGEPTADRTITLPDATGTIQLRVTDVSDTEISYLNGVTSGIQTQLDAKIAKSDITAKGAILVGTGSGTYTSQTVGTNGQVLTANSAQTDGVEWTTIPTVSAATSTQLGTVYGVTPTTVISSDLIGHESGLITTGANNTAFGRRTLYSNTSGTQNTAIGRFSLYLNTTASSNTAVGQNSLSSSTGAQNTAVGYGAGSRITTGFNNTVIGTDAVGINSPTNVTGSNNIVIGYDTNLPFASTSNQIVLGNSSITSFRIPGLGIDFTKNGPSDGTTSTASTGFGYMGIPQSPAATTGSYTVVAADAGEHIYTTETRTITIPANASVALPIGTTLTFIAAAGATATIAITSDTLLLAGPGTSGSRTLAPHGMATAVKVAATTWYISGNGLT